MAAFLDQYNLAMDVNFQKKVRMAAITAAIAIVAEQRQKGFDTYYNKRATLANTVLGLMPHSAIGVPQATATEEAVVRFSLAVASNPSIDAPSSDQDIQFTVNSMWDSLAGVTDDDRPEA